ncbi:MAG: hemerythrin domain-containing protein [Acidimicrobiales bacterium]
MKRDHRYVEGLLDQLCADPAEVTYDETARKNLVDYLVAAESRHEAAEEIVLWPAVRRRVPDGGELADTALRQETEGKTVLETLRFADSNSRQQLAGEFADLARAHVAFEENEVLPALRKTTLWPGAWLLGAKFNLAKRVSPTRPHPRGPNRRLGLLTSGLLTAGLDRLRDRVSGRHA